MITPTAQKVKNLTTGAGKFMKNNGKILLIVCEIALGILLFIDPLGFTGAVIKIAGALMLVSAVFAAVRYFREDPFEAHIEQGLAKALILLAAGLFCLIKTDWFLSTFPIFTMIYGVAILLTGIVRIQWTVDMIRVKAGRWYIPGIGALLAVILSLIIILNPFSATEVLWRFVAITLLVEAAADIAIVIFARMVEKELNKEVDYKE